VKGFGDFRNDEALTPEQLELIVSWVGGGVPEGEAKDLPPPPKLVIADSAPHESIVVSGEFTLRKNFSLAGLSPKAVPDDADFQITAERPDGSIEPLIWFEHYHAKFGHLFFYRDPIDLPAGTKIHGVPPGSSIALLSATLGLGRATPTP
jgi:hypothetical protein